jgi:hypothetical protein
VLFDSVGELEGCEGGAGGDVDDADAALELVVVRRDGGGAEDRGLADPGEADEGEVAVEGESAGVAGNRGDGVPVAGAGVDVFEEAEAGVEDEQGVVVPAGECGMVSPVVTVSRRGRRGRRRRSGLGATRAGCRWPPSR